MSQSTSYNIRKNRTEQGFSLIEMVTAMALFLIVTAAVYQVLNISLIEKHTVSTRIDAVKSARIALNYIRRDAVNAGLSYHNIGGLTPDGFVNKTVGVTTDVDLDDRDMLTGILSGPNVNTNDLHPTVNHKTDTIGFVTRDLTFNSGTFLSFTSTSASGSNVVVNTPTGGAANTNVYDLYLIETPVTQVIGLVTAKTGSSFTLGFGGGVDPLGVNLAADGSGSKKSLLVGTGISGTLKKINLVTYGVTPDGILVRKTYANNTDQPLASQIQTKELIYNVQDFQVTYLMDDGVISTDPTAGNNGRANQQLMNKVIQMEIQVTVLQDNSKSKTATPITVKEVISARNLRYTVE